MRTITVLLLLILLVGGRASSRAAEPSLLAAQPLTATGDLSAEMVAGIDKFLLRETKESIATRSKPDRERFRKIIGAIDRREKVDALELVGTTVRPAKLAETKSFDVFAARWPVFEGVHGEGLLLQPKRPPAAGIVVLPDADQTPEQMADGFAKRFAENGCLVLILTLINREDTFSGNPALRRFTNQPHREWIYRQAYQMGRHIIGYEVQKVLAAVDWLSTQTTNVGIAGYDEGGLIAFYSAALDPRIKAALVSGYFDSRQKLWSEPIYRNVFSLLRDFGDAEIASLIAPRKLIIEYSEVPEITGPPAPRAGRGGAAPGVWHTAEQGSVEAEFKRAQKLAGTAAKSIELVHGNEGVPIGPGSDYALSAFVGALGVSTLRASTERLVLPIQDRQEEQVRELQEFTQRLMRESEKVRDEFFWNPLKKSASVETFRAAFWENIIGRFPNPSVAANPRVRKIYDKPKWTGYEVMLDVFPDVFAWGYLLVPKDIAANEKRPVVVCQHGLEGVPEDTVSDDPKNRGFVYYRSFSARLADLGYVVYAPHNPYRGQDNFRVLQRKANPLGKTLFSVIIAQHQRTLEWLAQLPFVDPARIGFYGLSYGGKTAMRVPAILTNYCLSICSADFNEWIRKNVTTDSPYSYMFTFEYEMPEFDLANTFNYAEMAALISPRPFMVERGHDDGVAPDEWVAYEYAKVRRHYTRLGLANETEIEFFDGPHSINGVGTFKFLEGHLR
ncbi:MAG TPA: dienelactone hydrolase family protein [Candidatus Binatia bacterium]|nr:dienelactone hydrolase family protein [Candidatus Binatia bacterium]